MDILFDGNNNRKLKEDDYENMPCPLCGQNMFSHWIRDVKAKICHDCEDRIERLKKDLEFLKKANKI